MRATEIARLAGLSTDTLRGYERRGLLAPPARSANGYREYPRSALRRIRLIRQALAIGFTLEELQRVLGMRDRGGIPCRQVRELGSEKLRLLDEHLEELGKARERLHAVLSRWDAILLQTPQGARAALLDALDGLVSEDVISPLLPHGLRQRR